MGRLKQKYLDYDTACIIAQRMECRSRKEYHEWHDSNRPNNMPKNPDKVYSEWTSWNDYLDTQNSFKPIRKGDWRDYWEAVRWAQEIAQKNQLKTSTQWLNWCRNHGFMKEMPNDIPQRPDQVYKDQWSGWKNWLGINLQEKIKAMKEEVAVMALAYVKGAPRNMVECVVAKHGMSHLKDICEMNGQLEVFRVYMWEGEVSEQVKRSFELTGHNQGGSTWIVGNLSALQFELDMLLMLYKK